MGNTRHKYRNSNGILQGREHSGDPTTDENDIHSFSPSIFVLHIF
jgi:hypothetical protein